MNSRGCNPRGTRANTEPTLQGSNPGAADEEFGPFRAGAVIAWPTVGCRPRLFTLKPSGFRRGWPLAGGKLRTLSTLAAGSGLPKRFYGVKLLP